MENSSSSSDNDGLSSDGSSILDPEEEARNAALGLGGASLKAVMSEITNGLKGVGGSSSRGGSNPSDAIPVMGGEVLAILHSRLQNLSGDPEAQKLYETLLREAGKPYVKMLDVWMRTGRLGDPYDEMCVKESKFIDRGTLEVDYTDEYWERRYTVCWVQCSILLTETVYFNSCGMGQHWGHLLKAVTRLVSRFLERLVEGYQLGRVYHPFWKDGNIRFC